jgi:hypothetical protein
MKDMVTSLSSKRFTQTEKKMAMDHPCCDSAAALAPNTAEVVSQHAVVDKLVRVHQLPLLRPLLPV